MNRVVQALAGLSLFSLLLHIRILEIFLTESQRETTFTITLVFAVVFVPWHFYERYKEKDDRRA